MTMNLEHHHRRIRTKAKAVHWGLMPLALAVPVAWLYFTMDMCQEAESPGMMAACRVLGWTPLLPALLGALVCAWIVRDLAVLGHAVRSETHGHQGKRPGLHHAVHGYRAMDDRHRLHFHFAVGQVVVVTIALAAWLSILGYRSTH